MGSSRTRARTHVPCIGRRILNHCSTREALSMTFRGAVSVVNTMALGWKNLSSGYYYSRQLYYCSYRIIYCLSQRWFCSYWLKKKFRLPYLLPTFMYILIFLCKSVPLRWLKDTSTQFPYSYSTSSISSSLSKEIRLYYMYYMKFLKLFFSFLLCGCLFSPLGCEC